MSDGADMNIVIADFGLSVYAEANSKAFESTRSGNPRYLATELAIASHAARAAGGKLQMRFPMQAVRGHPSSTTMYIRELPAVFVQLNILKSCISPSARPRKASDLFSFAMLCIEVFVR